VGKHHPDPHARHQTLPDCSLMPELLIEEYQAPNGAVDFPFAYVYDATALTDGNTYQNVQVQLQNDSQFVLRAIRGATTVLDTAANGARFNYRNPSQSY